MDLIARFAYLVTRVLFHFCFRTLVYKIYLELHFSQPKIIFTTHLKYTNLYMLINNKYITVETRR